MLPKDLAFIIYPTVLCFVVGYLKVSSLHYGIRKRCSFPLNTLIIVHCSIFVPTNRPLLISILLYDNHVSLIYTCIQIHILFGQFQYQTFDFAANSKVLMTMQNVWDKKFKNAQFLKTLITNEIF